MGSNDKSDNSQKRCRCKKSKCLKLYCECFKHGLYCVELCSCQECCNSRDYEDNVDMARELIQTQDPYAFSSKICPLIESTTTQSVNWTIPIELKHRKGCSGKKSRCSKKYCECYLAHVGCCSECGCEGCENVFGKKVEYDMHSESGSTRAIKETQCYKPQFQHLSSSNDASVPQILTSDGNLDVVSLDQKFTPPDNMLIDLPQMMDLPNSSTTNDNILSVDSMYWPGSLVTLIPLDGVNGNEYNENSIDTLGNNTPNTLRGYCIRNPNSQAAVSSPCDRMDSNSKSDGQKQCKFIVIALNMDYSCKKCCNNRDYEDSVDMARDLTESQDPHAFSSKICPLIQPATSHNENENQPITIELKHRKGCNCKKSMCMKKYCECYLAHVGCCSEYRCKGCENVFGKKGEYNMHNESGSMRVINETECYKPQFQHSSNTDDASVPQILTSDGNVDMVYLDQQFTPPYNTLMDLPQMMDFPNSSTTNENIFSVDSVHWPGSMVNLIPLYGINVNQLNENPIDTIDNDMPNTQGGSYPSYQYGQQ